MALVDREFPHRHRVAARRAMILAALIGFVGTAVPAHAAWQKQVTASGSVSAAQLQLTVSGAEKIAGTITQSELRRTSLLTLTNTTETTSVQRPSVTVKFVGTNEQQILPFALLRTVWRVNDPSQCTASASPSPGTASMMFWGVPFTTAPVELAVAESLLLCVRTSLVDGTNIDSASGQRQFAPKVTATIGHQSFTFATTPVVGVIEARGFFAAGTPIPGYFYRFRPQIDETACIDVTGNQTAAGTGVGIYGCHSILATATQFNQHFELRPIRQAGSDLYAIVPRSAPRMALTAAGEPGSVVNLQSLRTDDPTQLWRVQRGPDASYQLVSSGTKRCLTAGSGGVLYLENCLGLSPQLFQARDRVRL